MKQYAVFLDASGLVAYFNIEDEFHKHASEIIDSEEFNLKFYTCDVTLLELQYVLWKKVDAAAAIDKIMGLTEAEDIEVLTSDMNDIFYELEIFKLHPMPSFDGLICAVMNRYDIEFLVSYDRNHFDVVEGIIRVENFSDLKSRIGKKR